MIKRRNRPIRLDALLCHEVPAHYNNTALYADLFGVEIELEGKKIISQSADIAKFWAVHNDGSLRSKKNGPNFQADESIEYVFRHPMNMEEAIEGLTILYKHLNSPGVKVFDSYRTSIHVHVNCMAETFKTIVNFITLAIIFDELFVSQNGQYRIGNNFALRTRDAEGQLNDLISSIINYSNPYSGISPNHRYSSINIASLGKFGTIEFRSLECTTDLERVIHWVKTCQALKTAARAYKNPRDIIETFSKKDPKAFLIHNLGAQAEKYLTVEDFDDMLHAGMRLAQDFAFCSEWQPPNAADLKETEDQLKKFRKSPQKLINMPGLAGIVAADVAAYQNIHGMWDVVAAPQPAPMGVAPAGWNMEWEAVPMPAPQQPAYVPDDDDEHDNHVDDDDEDDDL